jgi:hypothetical protein
MQIYAPSSVAAATAAQQHRLLRPHIRLYLQPTIGHMRLGKLHAADVAAVFEAIDELNDIIEAARTGSDPALVPLQNSSRAR